MLTSFLLALVGMLSIRSMCDQAAGEWLVTFLKKCRGNNYSQR